MKRVYETPMVEKLAFCYRDQVVAASGGVAGSSSDTGGTTSTPGFGQSYGNEVAIVQEGCKVYLLEQWGIGFCDDQ